MIATLLPKLLFARIEGKAGPQFMTRTLHFLAMDVAIVIPVFNRATILPDTLESVAAQTVQPSQVIVVDDGSTDHSAAAAERWFERESRSFDWKIVRTQHVSGGTARNRGGREADDCELLQFLDSDDVLPPDFLERAINVFRANPRVDNG